jgi:hypothetical protein
MKRLMALVAVLMVPAAIACADMAGNYTCAVQDQNGSMVNVPLNVTVDMTLGFPVVSYNNEPVPADNVSYDVPAGNGLASGTFKAYCDGSNKLVQEMAGKTDAANGGFDFTYVTTDYMTDANTLMLTETTTAFGTSQTSEITCTRN